MAIRLFDLLVSGIGLILALPILALAALGIRLSSPGPIFYHARRVGLGGREFVMYKIRTMHVDQGDRPSVITAKDDPRVFGFGVWLRRLRLDELPQLLNILRGDMSLVGPRPEAPEIVRDSYTPADHKTLAVLPGLLSPGGLYYLTHGEQLLEDNEDPAVSYVKRVLALKLAVDRVYVENIGLFYNLRLIARTAWVIACIACGRKRFPDPPELARARALLEAGR